MIDGVAYAGCFLLLMVVMVCIVHVCGCAAELRSRSLIRADRPPRPPRKLSPVPIKCRYKNFEMFYLCCSYY